MQSPLWGYRKGRARMAEGPALRRGYCFMRFSMALLSTPGLRGGLEISRSVCKAPYGAIARGAPRWPKVRHCGAAIVLYTLV